MEHVRSVAVGFWVGVGARDEDDDELGASHFLEHLLFKGTDSRSASDIAEAIDEAGGDLNAVTTKEYTAFEVRLLAEHLDVGLDILCDIFWSPALPANDVETEREVILEEILASADEPADLCHDLLLETIFPDDQLGRSILGSEASIKGIDRDTIAAFHAARYVSGDVVVAAAGDVDHDALVAGVSRRAVRRIGDGPPLQRDARAVFGTTRVDHRDLEQTHVVLGVPGVSRRDERRYALDVLVHALGGGLSSRLFQEVRERRGLAYDVYASRAAYEREGVVSLYAATAPRHRDEVVDVFVSQLTDIATRGLSDRELEIAKRGIRAGILLGLEDSGARLGRLARSQVALGEVPPLDAVLARYDSVSATDVAELAAQLFGDDPTLVTVGPRPRRRR